MTQPNKQRDMQHKKPKQSLKSNKNGAKQADKPLRSNVNEQLWQTEQKQWSRKHRNHVR